MVCMMALSMATSLPGLNCSMWEAWRVSAWPRGSMTMRVAPALAAFLKKLAATGWLVAGLQPMTMLTSELTASVKGAVTALEPMVSSSAATDEAWQSRVQ